jgi:F0F1-type ATP synthase membrane subunit b/b'
MGNWRRREWARREPEMSVPSQEQESFEDGEAERALHAEAGAELVDEAAPDVSAEPTEAVLPADLSDIGAEVGAVLKSAQEAAARIRNRANQEAAKLGEETTAAAEAQIAEAQRVAAEDRAEGERIRAEAQLYANETRADAETFAEQTRTDAEREAAKIVEEARARLEAADVEAAQKVRDLTANARERLNTLEAGSRRHEERLEHMRVVFHGMTSQLEELLGERDAERGDADPQDEEDLADALQPDSVSPRTR